MSYWEIQIGSSVQIVRATESVIRERMFKYVRQCRSEGCALSEITFTYRPMQVSYWR